MRGNQSSSETESIADYGRGDSTDRIFRVVAERGDCYDFLANVGNRVLTRHEQRPILDDTEPDQQTNGHHHLNGRNPVLVLNQNYEPLNVCNIRRAIILVISGKAEILEAYDLDVMTTRERFDAPSVIRLAYMIRRPHPRVKLCRREIFIRDNYTCQYCGERTHELTIDHVMPRSRGGGHSWENLVSACRPCNHRKGGKTLAEARLRLRREPFEPRAGRYYSIQRAINSSVDEAWLKFIPEFDLLPNGLS
jgi:5-methylcytosine-specific restriction endonuclease McrA